MGPRGPGVRDGGRIPAVLRRSAHPDIRENSVWQSAFPVALRFRFERPAEKPVASRPDQAVRQPEERRERHQRAQVVRLDGLDSGVPEKNRSPVHSQVQRTGRHE